MAPVFLGIDLHHTCFTVCFLYTDGRFEEKSFKLVELERFKMMLTKNMYVLLESTSPTFAFCDQIRGLVKGVLVADTYRLKLISESQNKTDKIDARKLANLLRAHILMNGGLINEVYIPEQSIRELRSLFTTNNILTREKTRAKNRIYSLLKQNLCLTEHKRLFLKSGDELVNTLEVPDSVKYQIHILLGHIDELKVMIEAISNKIKILGSKYYQTIDLLATIRGVSVIAACAIIADVGKVERFSNSKKFCSYLRTTPRVVSSNETVKILNVNRHSRSLALTYIVEGLNFMIPASPRLSRWYYYKTVTEKQKKGKMRLGAAHIMFKVIYQMLKHREPFRYCDDANYHRKMREYNTLLGKYGIVCKRA